MSDDTIKKPVLTAEQKLAQAGWRKAYYAANRERAKASMKAWEVANAEKRKAYRKAHYIANREEVKARRKEYCIANREKVRASKKADYIAHPEKARARHNAWRAANRDRCNAIGKAWRIANPEKTKSMAKAWKAENPEKRSRSSHLRRARKSNATIGDPAPILKWEKQWRKAKLVTCYWCNGRVAGKKAHADHIQPLSRGGEHSVENLCIACQKCNMSKHAKALATWNATLESPVLL